MSDGRPLAALGWGRIVRRGPNGLPEVARRYPAQTPARRLTANHMLLPKAPPGWDSNPVERALAVYTPPERRVLNKVAETADIVEVDGKAAYLLIPSTPELLDDLAVVGAQLVLAQFQNRSATTFVSHTHWSDQEKD